MARRKAVPAALADDTQPEVLTQEQIDARNAQMHAEWLAGVISERKEKVRAAKASEKPDYEAMAAQNDITADEFILNSIGTMMYFVDRLEGASVEQLDFHESFYTMLWHVDLAPYRDEAVNKYVGDKDRHFGSVDMVVPNRFSSARALFDAVQTFKTTHFN